MSHTPYKTNTQHSIIKPHGGYRNLESYKTATIIYDLTVLFCEKYVDRTYMTNTTHKQSPITHRSHTSYRSYYSRLSDQMIQAARSGKQNIAEASQASGTSNKTEIKLVSVARASFEELLQDYEDFLRQHNLPLWSKDTGPAKTVRSLVYTPNRSHTTYMSYLSSLEQAANCLICLIHQANFLLDRQLKTLEKSFIEHGGFTERLYKARVSERKT